MSVILSEFQRLAHSRPHRKGQWTNINCPSCGDKRKRGGFVWTSTGGFRYSCFNGGCEYNTKATGWEPGNGLYGRVKALFEKLGGNVNDIPLQERKGKSQKEEKKDPNNEIATYFPEARLPIRTGFLIDSLGNKTAKKVWEALLDRSPLYEEADFPFAWTASKPEYLLVPYLNKETIVGYMGKNMIDESAGFIQKSPGDFLFQQDTLRDSLKYAFVVESPLEAILLKGVATRSNKITRKQANLLNLSRRTPILVPDRRKGECESYLNAAEENNWFVSIPDWGYKDAGESIKENGLLYTVEVLISSARRDYGLIRAKCESYRS